VAAFVAVLALVGQFQPQRTPTVTVVAAARDLPAGTKLAASDLIRLELGADVVPSGSVGAPDRLAGAVLNGPVTARTPITSATVATGAALASPGFVVMAVPMPSAALADVVKAGSRIDLIASKGPVASNVRVVAAPAPVASGMLTPAERVLLVEVSLDAAGAVAAAVDSGTLTVTVR